MSTITLEKTGIPYGADEYVPEGADKSKGKTVTYTLKLAADYDSFKADLEGKTESAEGSTLGTFEGAFKDAKGGKDAAVWLAKSLALCKVMNDAGKCGDWVEDDKKASKLVREVGKFFKTKILKDVPKLKLDDEQTTALNMILEGIARDFADTDSNMVFDYEPKSRQSSTASQ